MPYFKSLLLSYLASYSGLSKACWQRIAVAFINTASGGVSYFLSLYFVKNLHFNIATAGFIISCYGIGTVAGGIFGGKLSDLIDPGKISAVSLFIKAIGFAILIKLNTLLPLCITLFFLGLSTYSFVTANNVWVLHHCQKQEDQKLKAMNILYAAANLGLGVAGVVIGFLSQFGFNSVFIFASLLLLFAAIYLAFQEKSFSQTSSVIEKISTAEQQNYVNEKQTQKNILLFILSAVFFVGFMIAQQSTTYLIYLHDTFPQLGMKAISFIFTLNAILIVLFQTPLVDYFKNRNKVYMIGIGACMMGVGMLILAIPIYAMAIISCVIYTVGEMLFFTPAQLLCYQYGGPKQKGQSMGLFQMAYSLSVVIGPLAGAAIYHQLGGIALWSLCGAIGLLCMCACHLLKHYG